MSNEPLYHLLDELPDDGLGAPLSVAVGVFDGVHLGHRALLQCVTNYVQTTSYWHTAALTFDPHPAAVFAPDKVPALLGTLDERAALLHEAGAEHVIVARFTPAFAALTPEEFIEKVLVRRLRAESVVVGDDFRFGCNRSGNDRTMRRAGADHGFYVNVIGAVEVDGIPVRSTTIRRMLLDGRVEEAARLLGRSYTLSGIVERGRQLGRTLGFPTANLASPPELLVPATGVYAGRVHLAGGENHRAAISVGENPTVGPDLPRTVEAHLLDGFDRDLYGQPLRIEFVSYLHPMYKFEGLPALTSQIARDVEEAKRLISR